MDNVINYSNDIVCAIYLHSCRMSDTTFENWRIILLLFGCLLRLYLVRPYIQVYLNTSLTFAEVFIDCTDKRILMILRDRVCIHYGIYSVFSNIQPRCMVFMHIFVYLVYN